MPVSDFLRKVDLFAELPEADLVRICNVAEEVRLQPGEELFSEGSKGDAAFIVRTGEIEVIKVSDGRAVLLAVRHSGDVIGEMSLLEESPRMATVRARNECKLIRISQTQFEVLLQTSASAAKALLHTVVSRWRGTEARIRQSEKMAQLGTLSAGLAHELNNPAAAVQRGAQQLGEVDEKRQRAEAALFQAGLSDAQRAFVQERLKAIHARQDGGASPLDPIEQSDREADAESWLQDHDVEEPWEIAPTMVELGVDGAEREALAAQFAGPQLGIVVRWLALQRDYLNLVEEVRQGAKRISELVRSLKVYSYLDQAPVQEVDVHEGLESTLVLLRAKLKKGIQVKREFSPELPRITAHGSELNQVWTNLIDNAIDAMDGTGELIIKTESDAARKWITVRIVDSGPGIPEAIQNRIFDAFFTTKAPGKGTGLGLDISYNIVVNKHGGAISVTSRPGQTCFTVKLPVDPSASNASESAAQSYSMPNDEKLIEILQAKTIAVVGASSRPDRPAHNVPRYLKAKGYRILPVNPNQDEILGEKAYPNVTSLPETPDVVVMFARGERLHEAVKEAIARRVPTVWIQEGIVDEEAASLVRDAGLNVVMDACIMMTHRRLMGRSA